MFAGRRFSLQSFHILVLASGSSIAVRTMVMCGSSRSALELLVQIFDLFAIHAMCHFSIEAIPRADHCDFGICVEEVQDSASRDL